MGKIDSEFEQITSRTPFWNGLWSKTESGLYFSKRKFDVQKFSFMRRNLFLQYPTSPKIEGWCSALPVLISLGSPMTMRVLQYPTSPKIEGWCSALPVLISLGSPMTMRVPATSKVSKVTKHRGNLPGNYVLGQKNSEGFSLGLKTSRSV